MTGDSNSTYLRRRAREERARASAAADMPARMAHAQLATLYDREADVAARSSPLPHGSPSVAGLFKFER